MPKFFVKSNQVNNDEIFILGEDVNHIKNVLRMKIGDTFNVCDELCSENYLVEIDCFEKDRIICRIKEKIQNNSESNVKVHIYQGLPKADKMEFIIQKSVELGVYKITPVEMKRCIVKLDNKDKVKKIERWQKISEVAAKQCGRDIIPQICTLKNIKEICNEFKEYDVVLICYENEKDTYLKDVLKNVKSNFDYDKKEELRVAVVIGPEGGLDINEVEYMKQNNAIVVSLGNRILRTETVGLNLLSIIMYEFERKDL